MKIIPHDYQAEAIATARQHILNAVLRLLIVAPTGAGKTTIAAEVIQGAVGKGRRVLFLAHSEELIDQASKRLDLYGIDHGIIMANHPRRKPKAPVQVASILTLVRREMPQADVVIVDEAHRAKAKSYLSVLAAYPGAVVLGLTATPWRLDGSGLGDLFDAMVQVCQPQFLMDRTPAVLVPPRVFAPSKPDMTGIKTTTGDYESAALQALMATQASVDELVRNWQRLASDRQTVVFASGINHSLMIRDAFRAAGVRAEHVEGNTNKDERRRILADLAAGRVQLVSNVGVLTEGWDCPAAACAVLARPTQSLSLYLQMVGRVLRAAPGKVDAIVLDHAGNTHMHGFATQDREWDLAGRKKKEKSEAPVKTCLDCYACVPAGMLVCPECHTPFPVASREGEGKQVADRDLVEITAADLARDALPPLDRSIRHLEKYRPAPGRKPTADDKRAAYDALAEQCLNERRAPGWIYHKFKAVFGIGPHASVEKASPHAEVIAKLKERERERKEAERIALGLPIPVWQRRREVSA